MQLTVHVDHSATVDHVVGGIEDTALFQQVSVAILRQLIIRTASDDLHFEPGQGFVVNRGTERAGGVHVGILIVDLLGLDRRGAGLLNYPLHLLGIDIGDDESGAFIVKMPSQVGRDLTAALYRHRLAREVVFAPADPGSRLHSDVDPVRRNRRGIARQAEQAGDMVGLQLDELHVGRAGADILGGDVAAPKRLDEAAVGPEERFPVRSDDCRR